MRIREQPAKHDGLLKSLFILKKTVCFARIRVSFCGINNGIRIIFNLFAIHRKTFGV